MGKSTINHHFPSHLSHLSGTQARPFVAYGSKSALNDFLTWLGCCRIQIHKLCLAAAEESNMCIFISRNMSQGGQKLHHLNLNLL